MIISLLLEIRTLKLLKAQCMISEIAIIRTVYVINLPVIKIRKKLSCIDLFLTNSPKSFQNTQAIEMGLSDFHKLVVTILKMYLPNNEPKVITYKKL